MKIASLDGERKQAKVQYTEHMNSYATTMFGRPMEKLNVSEGSLNLPRGRLTHEDSELLTYHKKL